MTTPEMFMWAATALNAGGACYYAWLIRRHNRLHGDLVYISKEFENELQKRVELIMDVMRLTSERKEFRDAAEFEARVAEKLAWHATIYYRRGCRYGDEDDTPSDFEILRDARIQVEEEMDGWN